MCAAERIGELLTSREQRALVDTTGSLPLCVDLDGTLIRSDVFIESGLALARRNPTFLLAYPFWLMRGRAHLKHQIARRARLNVSTLPYDERVRDWLATQSSRPLVLCTAADQILAEAVATHIGGFDTVIASDGVRSLSGRHKAAALVARYGERGFDYAGNEARDLDVWRHARTAFVVNGGRSLAHRAAQVCTVGKIFPCNTGGASGWWRAIRPHQWLKNILVFAPLLAAHLILEPWALARSALAFAIFCLCASSVYLLNDLLDLEADRAHPRKRRRPFAAGRLSLVHGLWVTPLMTLAAFAGAWALSPHFALALAGYYLLTLAYSFKLKQLVMIDVVVLAALYTVRIVAGTVALQLAHSFWLLAFSMFLFASLALVKRYTEVRAQYEAGRENVSGRGYRASDRELLVVLGAASGYISVLVLALYINSTASAALYHRPYFLWLLCPLLLYWISRVWVIAHRGEMDDDPVVFAIRDHTSQVVGALAVLSMLLAIR